MTPRLATAALLTVVSALALACGGDDGGADAPAVSSLVCTTVVSEAACDKTLRPIVFIHGTLGAGDNAEHIAMLFGSNGYCQDRFVAVDYNSVGGDPSAQVDALITKVLAETGQTKVDLMGHSQGAMWGLRYANDPERAKRVANYIHLAGMSADAPPAGVNTMSISSKSDALATSTVITGAARSVILETQDHMGVAMSTASFVEMYQFLLGKPPQYMDVQCGDEEITLAGKVASFGDNVPAAGATAEWYELGKDPWKRGKPVISATVAADGTIAPAKLRRGIAYESRLVNPDGKVVGHMYYTPWKRSDYLLRALIPSGGGLTGAITGMIPKDDNQSVIITRYNQSALRADLGQTLSFDGKSLLLPEVANAMVTTVALFSWDDNNNGVSDLTQISSFSLIPFVKGIDVFLPTAKPAFVEVNFGGAILQVPNWPSASEGPTVVMFQ